MHIYKSTSTSPYISSHINALEVIDQSWTGEVCFILVSSSTFYVHACHPVIPYLFTGLAGCSVDSGNSRGTRKLVRTPRVIKKKKSHINVLGPKSWILAYSSCVEVESMEDYCIPLWVDLTFHDREVFMWLLPSFLKKQIVEKWSVLSTLLLPSLAVSAVCTVFLEKSARIK
jgi:hypothetical protein